VRRSQFQTYQGIDEIKATRERSALEMMRKKREHGLNSLVRTRGENTEIALACWKMEGGRKVRGEPRKAFYFGCLVGTEGA